VITMLVDLRSQIVDIDIAAQIPHSALRVYVMGERAARKEPPTAEDLRHAAAAGALATTKPGAWDGIPTAAELEAFLATR